MIALGMPTLTTALTSILALLATAAVVAAVLPRCTPRGAWVCAGALGLAGIVVWAIWPTALWAAAAAVAIVFGQLGRHLGAARARHDAADSRVEAASTVAPPSVASVAPSGDAGSRSPAGPVSRSQPATLGRYRIDAQIGRGSMGAVYLGHDPQIGRQVAIKTLALSREFSGAKLVEARERFFREAETAGRLQHPDIVTIFDAGEAQDLAYIAMEFIRGHDLQMHASASRLLPLPQLLDIAARVADALAQAHSQGVVHRDIKPANVMIDPDAGLVKVMDFGVARITDASTTRTGLVLGTPSYMSPEQMAGRPVDGRSDLYSLGVMLFQLLTGRLPHNGDSMARLMFQIANEPAPDVRSVRPELPEALANIVALAVEKRPEVRYADGRQMAADLRAVAALLAAAGPPADAGPRDDFEKTVTFSRPDPRHNSGP
jgi:serine/threonine protein kinase